MSRPAVSELPSADALAVDLLDTPEAGGTAIRASALRIGAYAIVVLLSLASAPLVVRHLGVVGFGRYTQVVSLIALVGVVTDGGLTALGVREYATRSPERRRALVANLLTLRLVLTALGVAGAVGFAALAGYGRELLFGTLIAGVGLLVLVTQGTLSIPLAADLRLGWYSTAEVLRQLVVTGLIVAMVTLGAGVVAFLGAPIGGGLAALALTAWVVRSDGQVRLVFDGRESVAILRETLPLAAAVAVSNLYSRVVILLLSVIGTGLQVGFFALSYRVVEVLAALPGLLLGTLLPVLSRAARDDDARLAYANQRTFETSLVLGGWIAIGTFIGAPTAIRLLSGSDALVAVDVLRIQAATLFLAFLGMTWSTILVALRAHRALLIANALALFVTVGAALALVPPLGAKGGAAATVVGEVVLGAAQLALLRHRRPHLQLDLRVVPRLLAAVGLALGAGSVLGLPDPLAVALATLVYFGTLVLLRGIPPELHEALLLRLRR